MSWTLQSPIILAPGQGVDGLTALQLPVAANVNAFAIAPSPIQGWSATEPISYTVSAYVNTTHVSNYVLGPLADPLILYSPGISGSYQTWDLNCPQQSKATASYLSYQGWTNQVVYSMPGGGLYLAVWDSSGSNVAGMSGYILISDITLTVGGVQVWPASTTDAVANYSRIF